MNGYRGARVLLLSKRAQEMGGGGVCLCVYGDVCLCVCVCECLGGFRSASHPTTHKPTFQSGPV